MALDGKSVREARTDEQAAPTGFLSVPITARKPFSPWLCLKKTYEIPMAQALFLGLPTRLPLLRILMPPSSRMRRSIFIADASRNARSMSAPQCMLPSQTGLWSSTGLNGHEPSRPRQTGKTSQEALDLMTPLTPPEASPRRLLA
jgi:hypothetical protein